MMGLDAGTRAYIEGAETIRPYIKDADLIQYNPSAVLERTTLGGTTGDIVDEMRYGFRITLPLKEEVEPFIAKQLIKSAERFFTARAVDIGAADNVYIDNARAKVKALEHDNSQALVVEINIPFSNQRMMDQYEEALRVMVSDLARSQERKRNSWANDVSYDRAKAEEMAAANGGYLK